MKKKKKKEKEKEENGTKLKRKYLCKKIVTRNTVNFWLKIC